MIACFLLLAEAMVGVAITGERKWHASWWEWHGLIVLAYLVIGFAARREWREERFRELYLPSTRERRQEVSVLFATSRATRASRGRRRPRLRHCLHVLGYGGAPAHASVRHRSRRSSATGSSPRSTAAATSPTTHSGLPERRWPCSMPWRGSPTSIRAGRVCASASTAARRSCASWEGDGHVAYALVGDTVNTGSRLEGLAPAGGVLIGAETHAAFPAGVHAEARPGLRMKGKEDPVTAYVLLALP